MSGKHTKGTWKVEAVAYPAGKDISFEVLDDARKVVAQTLMREIGEGWRNDIIARDEANARLIAAAPDLLEALEYALPYLKACVPNPRNGVNHDCTPDINCVDRAIAAIARAKGVA